MKILCLSDLHQRMTDISDAIPNALICGHSHKRVIGEIIKGFYCVNFGSDYDVLMHYLLEL